MEDFNFGWISGFVHCPTCEHTWVAVVPFGQILDLECPKCHAHVGEIGETHASSDT